MKRGLKKAGIGFLFLGFALIINSSLITITGNVVSETVKVGGSVLGFIFIIGGIVLFLSQKGGGLERKMKIITDPQFDKSIKRVPSKMIETALSKIGTGLGNEEYMKEGPYEGHWSIRASKGARIYYLLEGDTAKIMAYEPSSRHR